MTRMHLEWLNRSNDPQEKNENNYTGWLIPCSDHAPTIPFNSEYNAVCDVD